MSNFLKELESLTRSVPGTLRVTIRGGVTRASFKRKGHRAEVVADVAFADGRYSSSPADSVLQSLLERLGWQTPGLTADNLVERMNPAQRQRARELVGQLQSLRSEVLHPAPIEYVERRLASPRSGLDPRLVQGVGDDDTPEKRGARERAAARRKRRRAQ